MADNDEQSKDAETGTEQAAEQPDVRPQSEGEMIIIEVEAPEPDDGAPGQGDAAEPEQAEADQAEAEQAEADQPAEPEEPDLEAELAKSRNQLLRVAADFDNFKKRSRRDAQEASLQAKNSVLQDILPVIDNLERAVGHAEAAEETPDPATLLEGVQMVLKQFTTAMERFEVKGFVSLGEPFDPALHEALQKRETEGVEPGTVVEEFRKGYLMGERLIRPAMVVVAAAPAAPAPDNDDDNDNDEDEDEDDEDTGGGEDDNSNGGQDEAPAPEES